MRRSRRALSRRERLPRPRPARHTGGKKPVATPGDASDPRGFPVLVARYLEHRGVLGFSWRTIQPARSALSGFAAWCLDRGLERPAEVSREALERYQRFLYHYRKPDGKPLAVATQSHRLVLLRSFFRWLTRERYLLLNPASEIELPKTVRRLPVQGLTRDEVEQVMAAVDLAAPLGLRDRAILETLYSTGVRRSELIGLDLYDVDFARGWVTVRQGKGGKDRVVPIGERALAWIRKYLDELRPELALRADEGALFLAATGERLSAARLSTFVPRLFAACGIVKPGACHLFRHAMATLMLENGADIRYIQEMLGHALLSTTQGYTQVAIHKLKEIHNATHPGAKLARRSEGRERPAATASASDLDELLETLAGEIAEEG